MAKLKFRPLLAGLALAFVTALCLVLILQVESETKTQIKYNQKQKLDAIIANLLPEQILKNKDSFECYLVSHEKIGSNMTLYVAKKDNKPLGYILSYSTARGYSNPLIFIAGFSHDFKVYKVDIQLSRETPGIGDKIDRNHGNYLDQFFDKDINNTVWDIKKFGGDFDYFTGATITSRSVVLATKDALEVLAQIDLNTLKQCKVK